YAIGCKASAQAVAPHMHVGYGLHDPGSVEAFTIPVHCPEDGASADLLIVKLSSVPWHSNQKLQSSTLLSLIDDSPGLNRADRFVPRMLTGVEGSGSAPTG